MSSLDPYARPDDAFNPYASPEAAPGRPEFSHGPETSSLPFGVGPIFGRTWEIFKAEGALCVGAAFACGVMNTIVPYLPLVAMGVVAGLYGAAVGPGGGLVPGPAGNAGNPPPPQVVLTMGLVGVVLGLLSFVFVIWVGIGQTLLLLNVARGRRASFGDVFLGGPFIFRTVVAALLFGFMLFGGLGVLGGIAGGVASVLGGGRSPGGSAAFAVGMGVAVVLMSLAAIRLSQFHYLIIDRDAGALGSLKLSVEATRGRGLGLIGLFLLGFLVNFGGLLACGVGLIVTIPFTMLMLSVAYLAMVGGPVADPAGRGKPYAPGDPFFEA